MKTAPEAGSIRAAARRMALRRAPRLTDRPPAPCVDLGLAKALEPVRGLDPRRTSTSIMDAPGLVLGLGRALIADVRAPAGRASGPVRAGF
jgi:hypothetical protein